MDEVNVKDFNVYLMNNVAEVFKNSFNEVINIVKRANHIYPRNKVYKLLEDLKNKRLEIKTENVIDSTRHVANELDRISYSYGYVDFGRENIIYNGTTKKKIVVVRPAKGK